MDNFTWNIQFAGYDFDQYDDKGVITYDYFITEFDKFPWIEQMEKANTIKRGCSATLSVKDLKTGQDLWVSIAGEKGNYEYLIGYVHSREVRGFLGFGKAKLKLVCDILQTQDISDIKHCFKLFFHREQRELEYMISQPEKA